jgi:hypothetical protein
VSQQPDGRWTVLQCCTLASVLPADAEGVTPKHFVITDAQQLMSQQDLVEVVILAPAPLYRPDRDYGYYQVGPSRSGSSHTSACIGCTCVV